MIRAPRGTPILERGVWHYHRLVPTLGSGRDAARRAAIVTGCSLSDLADLLRSGGEAIETFKAAGGPKDMRPVEVRVVEGYRRRLDEGHPPRTAAHLTSAGHGMKMPEVEQILLSQGITLPPRRDGHAGIKDPAERIKHNYLSKVERGMPGGKAVTAIASANRELNADKIRALLRSVGIEPPASQKGKREGPKRESKPKVAKETPKPIVREHKAEAPKPVVIRAEYRDESPVRFEDPHELMKRMQDGKTARFVSAKELFATVPL